MWRFWRLVLLVVSSFSQVLLSFLFLHYIISYGSLSGLDILATSSLKSLVAPIMKAKKLKPGWWTCCGGADNGFELPGQLEWPYSQLVATYSRCKSTKSREMINGPKDLHSPVSLWDALRRRLVKVSYGADRD